MNPPEEPDNQQAKQNKDREDFARGGVLNSMLRANQLNDEMLNAEEGKILLTQPFSKWPEYLQERLAPFGARMIE
ncbi:MAG: hypothetical protein WCS31_12990 [Verrucomicrobiae bacterium]